jgi:hypothetical protein
MMAILQTATDARATVQKLKRALIAPRYISLRTLYQHVLAAQLDVQDAILSLLVHVWCANQAILLIIPFVSSKLALMA